MMCCAFVSLSFTLLVAEKCNYLISVVVIVTGINFVYCVFFTVGYDLYTMIVVLDGNFVCISEIV